LEEQKVLFVKPVEVVMPLNLTRRELLKDLGLLGLGVSLAPGSVAGSAEFDWENEKTSELVRPSWVTPTSVPTMEVDWDRMQRFSEWRSVRGSLADYIGAERDTLLNQLQTENLGKWLNENKPGYTLKDRALSNAAGQGAPGQSFLPPKGIQGPDKLGVTKWTGTPEDASVMVTAALRHLGAGTVGFVELDTRTTEKLIYAQDPDRKEIVFADVDQPSENDKQRVIPKRARWVIVWTIPMSQETMKTSPTVLCQATTQLTYSENRIVQLRLQYFLGSLGYLGLGESSTNALGIAPALGTMAGLGEMSRLNRMVSPEWGPITRVFKMITDLPLAPTQPINAGIMQFCKVCKRCAQFCPCKALSLADEPTWEIRGGWNNPGHKAYFEDSTNCRSYWRQVGTNCGICFSACPFASKNMSFYDSFRNALTAVTPVFDSTLKIVADMMSPVPNYRKMGDPLVNPEDWWKRVDLPIRGYNSARGISNL
jgi:epoxyqueuosine reductase